MLFFSDLTFKIHKQYDLSFSNTSSNVNPLCFPNKTFIDILYYIIYGRTCPSKNVPEAYMGYEDEIRFPIRETRAYLLPRLWGAWFLPYLGPDVGFYTFTIVTNVSQTVCDLSLFSLKTHIIRVKMTSAKLLCPGCVCRVFALSKKIKKFFFFYMDQKPFFLLFFLLLGTFFGEK